MNREGRSTDISDLAVQATLLQLVHEIRTMIHSGYKSIGDKKWFSTVAISVHNAEKIIRPILIGVVFVFGTNVACD